MFCDELLAGALSFSDLLLSTLLAATSPSCSPLGPIKNLFFQPIKRIKLRNIPTAAAKNPHLKSAGLPVSPK
jgi:hypothetical protein